MTAGCAQAMAPNTPLWAQYPVLGLNKDAIAELLPVPFTPRHQQSCQNDKIVQSRSLHILGKWAGREKPASRSLLAMRRARRSQSHASKTRSKQHKDDISAMKNWACDACWWGSRSYFRVSSSQRARVRRWTEGTIKRKLRQR